MRNVVSPTFSIASSNRRGTRWPFSSTVEHARDNCVVVSKLLGSQQTSSNYIIFKSVLEITQFNN